METSKTLHIFQKNINEDSEVKNAFIKAENVNSDSDSEYDSDNKCKIIIPKSKNKNKDTSQELLAQLMNQNQVLAKMQKKFYKLKTEMDREEITSRYIKLDLNNVQVKLDENKEKLNIVKKQLKNSRIENLSFRVIVISYIVFHIYFFFYKLVY